MKESIIKDLLENMLTTCRDVGKMSKTDTINALVTELNYTHAFASFNKANNTITLQAGVVVLATIICEPQNNVTVVTTPELTDELFKTFFKMLMLTTYVINMRCTTERQTNHH